MIVVFNPPVTGGSSAYGKQVYRDDVGGFDIRLCIGSSLECRD
jgi:hypothetical protein